MGGIRLDPLKDTQLGTSNSLSNQRCRKDTGDHGAEFRFWGVSDTAVLGQGHVVEQSSTTMANVKVTTKTMRLAAAATENT